MTLANLILKTIKAIHTINPTAIGVYEMTGVLISVDNDGNRVKELVPGIIDKTFVINGNKFTVFPDFFKHEIIAACLDKKVPIAFSIRNDGNTIYDEIRKLFSDGKEDATPDESDNIILPICNN